MRETLAIDLPGGGGNDGWRVSVCVIECWSVSREGGEVIKESAGMVRERDKANLLKKVHGEQSFQCKYGNVPEIKNSHSAGSISSSPCNIRIVKRNANNNLCLSNNDRQILV